MHPSQINLINVFSYYITIAFIVGTVLRWRNYRAMLKIIVSFQGRWPKLLRLVSEHREVFWQWPTILPAACTLFLMTVHLLASWLIWSQARVTPADLVDHLWSLALITLMAGLMLLFDGRIIFQVTHFDRLALESDFDRAEHWLGTWKAPAVKVLTFGFINPRKMVNDQVRSALIKANEIVNGQFWLWAFQFVVRLAFGLAVWIAWFVNAQQINASGLG
jgi:hypothetical protein